MNRNTKKQNPQSRAQALWTAEPQLDTRSARYAEADRSRAEGSNDWGRTGRRAAQWVDALHAYEDFADARGRAPRENTRNRSELPAAERRMGEWARYQRRFDEKLCRYQVIRLDLSPAFAWDPHEHLWQQNFAACVAHFRMTRRMPYLNGSDQSEFALARWLGRQLRQMQTGSLPASRATQIAELLALRRGID